MKQSNILKTLSSFIVMIVTAVAFGSCSSEKDEPENPDNSESGIGMESMISYTTLPGTWIIESIKEEETGKEVKINQTVTFSQFKPTQQSSNVVSQRGYQIWAESYNDILSYIGHEEGSYDGVIIGFCKEERKDLSSSNIYSVSFNISGYTEENYFVHSFALTDFHLSGNTLIAKEGAYLTIIGTQSSQVVGAVTMKKL